MHGLPGVICSLLGVALPRPLLPSLLRILPGAGGCLFQLQAYGRAELRVPMEAAAGEQVASLAAGPLPEGLVWLRARVSCREAVKVASLPYNLHHSIFLRP